MAFAYFETCQYTVHPIHLVHGIEAWVPANVLVPPRRFDSQVPGTQAEFVSSMLKLEIAFGDARLNSAMAQ